ncbi:GNAT family N-acetyltransferase [Bifidobacterium biavatii]|uniref:Acetyltransferase, GNAT family n=1 Tax=Bifidobacterium biavatii DSM 23969 TaxID=1437608 RepID=A0A086ZZ65_9BIFI|nr:GNAT family N-acetyltransferase [Bifidobacterium biavatii]KFI51815.1 acetyltransferase, GNAT family [Bifidobacterium biavatii DSM 23969]
MQLIETWLADRERTFDLFAKFPTEETGFENPAAGMSRERFAAYVQGLRDEALGIGLPEGWVPATKYILVNDEGEYVGIFNLRHRLTDFLREGPGHIGYGIAHEYRGRGYATAGLKLTLAKARELGIREAYLCVHKTNPSSLAVQRHCGARIDHEDEREYYTRINTSMGSTRDE